MVELVARNLILLLVPLEDELDLDPRTKNSQEFGGFWRRTIDPNSSVF